MEPATRDPSNPLLNEAELRSLLDKLTTIKGGSRELILSQIDPQHLDLLCQKNPEDAIANQYCNNFNFWQDLVLIQGYDLPDSFPEIIDIMRTSDKVTRVEVIKSLFFRKRGQASPYFRTLANKIMGPDQLILDAQYLRRQIDNYRDRRGKTWPAVYLIYLDEEHEAEGDEGPFPVRTDYRQLLQYLVDSELKLSSKNILNSFWYGSSLKIRPSLQQQIADQEVAMIESFLREGDLVGVISGSDPDDPRFYYYFTGTELILMKTHLTGHDYYLPVEAASFLGRLQMFTWDKPFYAYKMAEQDYIHGFFVDDKFLDLASPKEGKLIQLDGYEFWVKFDEKGISSVDPSEKLK